MPKAEIKGHNHKKPERSRHPPWILAEHLPKQRWLETNDSKTKDVIIGHDGQLTSIIPKQGRDGYLHRTKAAHALIVT